MAVSLNKMKSAFRIGDGETMIALAAAVNGGALQADWREPEPIGSVGQARFLDGKKFNFKKQVDYAVWASLFMIGCAVVFSISKLKMRQRASNPRPSPTFFRDRKSPRKQRKIRYPRLKRKALAESFALSVD